MRHGETQLLKNRIEARFRGIQVRLNLNHLFSRYRSRLCNGLDSIVVRSCLDQHGVRTQQLLAIFSNRFVTELLFDLLRRVLLVERFDQLQGIGFYQLGKIVRLLCKLLLQPRLIQIQLRCTDFAAIDDRESLPRLDVITEFGGDFVRSPLSDGIDIGAAIFVEG